MPPRAAVISFPSLSLSLSLHRSPCDCLSRAEELLIWAIGLVRRWLIDQFIVAYRE